MNSIERALVRKRDVLLQQLSVLSGMLQGSYLERFSVCSRRNCACHRGRKHGPRAYIVIYEEKKQRQVYVPQPQKKAVKDGIRQHKRLERLVKQITRINLRLMRAGALAPPTTLPHKGGP